MVATLRSCFPALGLLVCAQLAACNCGGAKLSQKSKIDITFLAPTDGADLTLNATGTADVSALASDTAGMQSLTLSVASWDDTKGVLATPVVIGKPCAVQGTTDVTCKASFDPAQFHPDPAGFLTLIADAVDAKEIPGSLQIRAHMAGPHVTITSPPLTQGITPPAAIVKGPSTLTATVTDQLPLTSVVFRLDENIVIATVNGPAAGNVDGGQFSFQSRGLGRHKLTVVATNQAGQTGMAYESVNVLCGSDADCLGGQRCCLEKGDCHTTVPSLSNCDTCDKPCPTTEACLPGTCGQIPLKCRGHCDPGSMDRPASDTCGPNNYCLQLPPEQATPDNQGGACAVGDNCDVFVQNCSAYPLDRSKPIDASTNPSVPSTCVPAGVHANVCYPSGPIGDGQQCSDATCLKPGSSTAQLCAPGLLCVTPIDPFSHQPLDVSRCRSYCHYDANGNPFLPQSGCGADGSGCCPSGQNCGGLLGAGYVPLSVGACG